MKKLIQKSSTYMIGEIIIMLGGFISLPIFTRLLTKQEYGVMSLISITLSLVEEISTLGVKHAVNRYYISYENENESAAFYSTTIISSLMFGIIGTIITITVTCFLAHFNVLGKGISSLVTVAALLIVTRLLTKVIGCLYRNRQRAKTYSLFAILTKYLGMGISIILVAVYLLGLKGYFIGLVTGEIIALVLLIAVMLREFGTPKHSLYSYSILQKMVCYGFPLVFAGFANLALTISDRYFIGWFMTAEAVALYSVPYNLCFYILAIFVSALEFAYVPLVMQEWEKGEHELARQGVSKVIRIYCMFAIPVIFGVCVLGAKLITILASVKYAEASFILPYVLIGEMIMGISSPLMMGFIFMQKPGKVVKYKIYGVVLNFAMNAILIPRMGLMGAALATLCSYLFFVVLGARESSKYFKIQIPYVNIMVYGVCSVFMFAFLKIIEIYAPAFGLVVSIAAGIFVYSVLLVLFDKEVRNITYSGMHKIAFKVFG